jgi:thymidylate kinase
MKDEHTPQWLQEVLKRGFKVDCIHHDFDNSFFGYIDQKSKQIVKVPNRKLYVLEGLPGAGKTSIVENLSITKKEIEVIPQILPHEPTFDQAMSQAFYLQSEELKTQRYNSSDRLICVSDRYYVSTLGFYWAYDKIHHTNTYAKVLEWYRAAIKQHEIIRPYTVFHIKMPIPLSLERKGRVLSTDYANLWLNASFLEYFNQYYEYFYREIEPQTTVIEISGLKSLQTVQESILEIINDTK